MMQDLATLVGPPREILNQIDLQESEIEIEEKSTDMYLTDDIQDLKDPVKFSRARITVGMFRTPSVYKIKTNDIVIEDYKASKTAKDRYDNLEFI